MFWGILPRPPPVVLGGWVSWRPCEFLNKESQTELKTDASWFMPKLNKKNVAFSPHRHILFKQVFVLVLVFAISVTFLGITCFPVPWQVPRKALCNSLSPACPTFARAIQGHCSSQVSQLLHELWIPRISLHALYLYFRKHLWLKKLSYVGRGNLPFIWICCFSINIIFKFQRNLSYTLPLTFSLFCFAEHTASRKSSL